MKHSSKSPRPAGRTRWRRFGVAAGAGLGLVGILGYLGMTGALALSFAFSGIPFTLSADRLTGQHFVQYAYPDNIASEHGGLIEKQVKQLIGKDLNSTVDLGNGVVLASDTVTQLKSATITGLNQQVCAEAIPGVLSIRVYIVAGGDTTADNLTIQAPALTADNARFREIIIGQALRDALRDQGFEPGQFTDPYNALEPKNPVGASFAQAAREIELTTINQVGVGTEAGLFNIRGLKLYAEFVHGCL